MYMSASCTKGRGETASTGRGARRSWGLLDAHTVSWRSRVGALRESDEDDGATVPWCIYGAHGLVDCRSCATCAQKRPTRTRIHLQLAVRGVRAPAARTIRRELRIP